MHFWGRRPALAVSSRRDTQKRFPATRENREALRARFRSPGPQRMTAPMHPRIEPQSGNVFQPVRLQPHQIDTLQIHRQLGNGTKHVGLRKKAFV